MTNALRDEPSADRWDLGTCDRVFFIVAERFAQIPAVEVGAVERRADVEVRLERGDDPLERVEVGAMLGDEALGGSVFCCAESPPLPEPPAGGALIVGFWDAWALSTSAARSAPSTSKRAWPWACSPSPRSCMTVAAKSKSSS